MSASNENDWVSLFVAWTEMNTAPKMHAPRTSNITDVLITATAIRYLLKDAFLVFSSSRSRRSVYAFSSGVYCLCWFELRVNMTTENINHVHNISDLLLKVPLLILSEKINDVVERRTT